MTQYIDKSAVVAEIESKKKYAQTLGNNAINGSMQQFYDGMKQGCVDILSFLDTLQQPEVDLNEEVKRFAIECGYPLAATIDFQFARHFYNLGQISKPKIWHDVLDLPKKDSYIVIVTANSHLITCYYGNYHRRRKCNVNILSGCKRWAYLSDILPKEDYEIMKLHELKTL